MTLGLTVQVLYTIQPWSGLYLWSVLRYHYMEYLHTLCWFFLLYCIRSCNVFVSCVLAECGWIGMMTVFALVLYSKLNLLSFIIQKAYI